MVIMFTVLPSMSCGDTKTASSAPRSPALRVTRRNCDDQSARTGRSSGIGTPPKALDGRMSARQCLVAYDCIISEGKQAYYHSFYTQIECCIDSSRIQIE
jgi:hypothetical protein